MSRILGCRAGRAGPGSTQHPLAGESLSGVPTRAGPASGRSPGDAPPQHGSGRNRAEIELSVRARKRPERVGTRALLQQRVAAWEQRRNRAGSQADGPFTTGDARLKLRQLYPTVEG
jgi:hypothetical protein